jgi:proliferating cell nuclear antigen
MDSTFKVHFKTVQTNAIKILFETLKNILSDVTFKVDKKGVKLTSVDGTNKAIVSLYLDAEKFEEYTCSSNTNISLNLLSVFKIIKSVKNSDTVSFTIYNSEPYYIYISHSNSDKKCKHRTKLRLLDINDKIYQIPDMQFDSYITMSSNDFLTYISELAIISNEINVSNNNNKLILCSKGDFAEQTIEVESSSVVDENFNKENESGDFNIKYIQMFTKATNLCNTVEIFIKNNYPLTLLYNVANLGNIKFCLIPN